MPKTIFITGIAGFLGSHLADSFIKEGHRVVGCDNLLGGYLDNVPAKAEFYKDDCVFLNSMINVMKGADVVYHCAATAYKSLSVFSPYFITKNIVEASVSVISSAIQNKVKRFIFCSSMARYGENTVPFTEDMIPNPNDPYGIAKYASELILRNLAEVHEMEFVVAVPHDIIGPRQKYDDPYRNVAAIMINLMLQNRQPIIYGDGEQKRCFSFVQDDVKVLEKLAFADNVSGQVINIGPDEEFITVNYLAQTIARLLNFDLNPVYAADRPCEIKLANCSAQKARRLLGYKTEYSLERGLREMIDYIKAKGTKEFKYYLDLEIINEKTPETWKNKLF